MVLKNILKAVDKKGGGGETTDTPVSEFLTKAVAAQRSPSREKDPLAVDSRTALPGGRNRASCGPTAGRGDHRSSPAPPNRRFQQPSSRKPAQPMQIRPATASFPKSRLPQSFLRQAFSENSKGFVVVFKIGSKRTPKESAQLENRDASRECSRPPLRHPPTPAPLCSAPRTSSKTRAAAGRASEEESGPRRAVPALPAEAPAGTETASAAAAARTQPSRNARSTWKKRPKVRFPLPAASSRPAEVRGDPEN